MRKTQMPLLEEVMNRIALCLSGFVALSFAGGAHAQQAPSSDAPTVNKPAPLKAPARRKAPPPVGVVAPAGHESVPPPPAALHMPPPAPAIVPEVAPVEASTVFPAGKYALQGMFPNGGSQVGSPAFGMRYVLQSDLALSGWVQLGYDKAAKTNSFGLSGKAQKFLKSGSRAMPYGFGLASFGKNGGDNVKGDEAKAQFSLSGGVGVEVFLIPEISTFVEGGIGVKLLPSDALTLGTASAAFGLSYNFDL